MEDKNASQRMKPKIMQHYAVSQVNNGGPATGAILLMNSFLKDEFDFIPLQQTFAPHGLSFRLLIDFYKKIKYVNPQILHIRGLQSEGLYGLLAGRLAGCKRIVVSVHGLYSDDTQVNVCLKIIFRRIIEPLTLRLADLVYCVCEYAVKRPIIYKNAIHLYGYIYNAAPDYSSYNKHLTRLGIRKQFNIKDEDILITTISRITIDKGFSTLVEAIKILGHRKNIVFLVVGEGPYYHTLNFELQTEILKGSVLLIGKSSNVAELLLASDIFALPSLHENLSNALLEACAASLPCIVTNVGGNPEIIINEETGLIIEPNNSRQLVEALEKLIYSKDLRCIYGSAANIRMRKYFSTKIVFENISTMYNSLLKN